MFYGDTEVDMGLPKFDHSYSALAMGFETIAAGATPVFGSLLYMQADGELNLADADAGTTCPAIAMALGTTEGKQLVMYAGSVRDDSWNWTLGAGEAGLIYLSTTAGGMTQTKPVGAGDRIQCVGRAIDADRMFFIGGIGWINPSLITVPA